MRSNPWITSTTVWRAHKQLVLAEQIKFNSKFENSEIELRSDMGFPGAENIQAGTSMSMKHGGGSSFNSIKTGGSVVYS